MVTKASPLLGYNTNVRHQGRVFHIQTEDSGVRYGHVITHLFMDGGRILKTLKTSYAEHVDSERRTELVRDLMKRQHKAMFVALRDGRFDSLVYGPAASAEPPAPESLRSLARGRDEGPARAMVAGPRGQGAPAGATAAAPSAAASRGTPRSPAPRSPARRPSTPRPPPPAARRASSPRPPPPRRSAGPPPLIPRPPAVGVGRVPSRPPAAGPPASAPPAGHRPGSQPAPAAHAVSPVAGAGERRAPAPRPTSAFGQARPQQGKSIFGEDVASDKSLDDVILTFLGHDGDDEG